MDEEIVREALLHYHDKWSFWLRLRHTTEAERELARVKIALINEALKRRTPVD